MAQAPSVSALYSPEAVDQSTVSQWVLASARVVAPRSDRLQSSDILCAAAQDADDIHAKCHRSNQYHSGDAANKWA
jgi:hypothetical protein